MARDYNLTLQEVFEQAEIGDVIHLSGSINPIYLYDRKLVNGKYYLIWEGGDAVIITALIVNGEYYIEKKKPKLVEHWPAVIRRDDDGFMPPEISDELFSSLETAKLFCDGVKVYRLATEYPPIMLEVKE